MVGILNNSSESSSDSNLFSKFSSPVNKKLLGSYLAGLIEGDGSIIVPKTIRNQSPAAATPPGLTPSESKLFSYMRLA
jgi:hypothetical protein